MQLPDLKYATPSEYRYFNMETQEVRTCLAMTLRPCRAAIRIHEDFAFKRKQQVVFQSDKKDFVRPKPACPPSRSGILLQSRYVCNG